MLWCRHASPADYRECSFGSEIYGRSDPAEGRFVLADAFRARRKWKPAGWGNLVRAGQQVRLEGIGTTHAKSATASVLGNKGAVVDNGDGIHAMSEKSGTVFLKAGRTPICAWTGSTTSKAMDWKWITPDRIWPRQPVPASALFRAEKNPGNATTNSLGPA